MCRARPEVIFCRGGVGIGIGAGTGPWSPHPCTDAFHLAPINIGHLLSANEDGQPGFRCCDSCCRPRGILRPPRFERVRGKKKKVFMTCSAVFRHHNSSCLCAFDGLKFYCTCLLKISRYENELLGIGSELKY